MKYILNVWNNDVLRCLHAACNSAHTYHMEYLEDVYHDNKYITAYFYHIDERREKRVYKHLA